jgi:hypothetical protein
VQTNTNSAGACRNQIWKRRIQKRRFVNVERPKEMLNTSLGESNAARSAT